MAAAAGAVAVCAAGGAAVVAAGGVAGVASIAGAEGVVAAAAIICGGARCHYTRACWRRWPVLAVVETVGGGGSMEAPP